MKAYQAIGYAMLQTTAITAFVGAGTVGRVYHGNRPPTSTLPAINYFKMPGGRRYAGLESESWAINCRANNIGDAENLALVVKNLWAGAEGMTTYGDWNGFDIQRASITDQGTIPEPEDNVFNSVLDLHIVYRASTVS